MSRFADMCDFYEEEDALTSMSISALLEMKGEAVAPIAEEILDFLATRPIADPFRVHKERAATLNAMQAEFGKTGRYPASRYADVVPVDDEIYKLSLLISFVTTIHRFEVLEQLRAFVKRPCKGPNELLSIGFGTGYELRWAREHCRDWTFEAFDASEPSLTYATSLLEHFGCATDGLRTDLYPLESEAGIEQYEGRFGKIVMCEVLEHLEDPAHAIRNLARSLHPDGHMFLTMAINIAQEDHIHLYESPRQASEQVEAAGHSRRVARTDQRLPIR